MNAGPVPEFRVLQVLDSVTVVIGGEAIGALGEGDELYVVGIGRNVPTLEVPLVVPKAELEVTSNAGAYVIAQPPELFDEEVDSPFRSALGETRRVNRRRPPLKLRRAIAAGNPAGGDVSANDVVIRKKDLAAYVRVLAARTNDT